MHNGKYIVFNWKGMFGEEFETPVLFPGHVTHSDMARTMQLKDNDIISAGFFQVDGPERVYCHGESVSLKKKSRIEDRHLIERFIK